MDIYYSLDILSRYLGRYVQQLLDISLTQGGKALVIEKATWQSLELCPLTKIGNQKRITFVEGLKRLVPPTWS